MSDEETDYMNAQVEADAKENEIMERTKELQAQLSQANALVSQWVDNHAKVHVKHVRVREQLTIANKEIEVLKLKMQLDKAQKRVYADFWGQSYARLVLKNEQLRALCLREALVLENALTRTNNKSMIAVVANSLKEQALKDTK